MANRGVLEGGRSHRFVIDGSSLGSGNDLLHVQGESFEEARPVTVVK